MGIHLFNRNIITKEQTQPSVSYSTKESFPLEHPGPVRAVMTALYENPPISFEIQPV